MYVYLNTQALVIHYNIFLEVKVMFVSSYVSFHNTLQYLIFVRLMLITGGRDPNISTIPRLFTTSRLPVDVVYSKRS